MGSGVALQGGPSGTRGLKGVTLVIKDPLEVEVQPKVLLERLVKW